MASLAFQLRVGPRIRPALPVRTVRVDFETRNRTLRRSGELYGAIARANAVTPELVADFAPDAATELFGGNAV